MQLPPSYNNPQKRDLPYFCAFDMGLIHECWTVNNHCWHGWKNSLGIGIGIVGVRMRAVHVEVQAMASAS